MGAFDVRVRGKNWRIELSVPSSHGKQASLSPARDKSGGAGSQEQERQQQEDGVTKVEGQQPEQEQDGGGEDFAALEARAQVRCKDDEHMY